MKEKYWIAFSSIEQIDSRFTKRLYDYFGDIEHAFNCNIQELENNTYGYCHYNHFGNTHQKQQYHWYRQLSTVKYHDKYDTWHVIKRCYHEKCYECFAEYGQQRRSAFHYLIIGNTAVECSCYYCSFRGGWKICWFRLY